MANEVLSDIVLLTSETRCMAGQTYYLFFNLNPSTYNLRTPRANSTSTDPRSDLYIYTEVDDSLNLIHSHSIETWNSRNPNNLRVKVVFKEGGSGTVGVRMCVKDTNSGDIIKSNKLELTVSNDPSVINTGTAGIHGSKEWTGPETIYLNEGESIDCSQYIRVTGSASKYFYLTPSSDNVMIGTDGVTVYGKGSGRSYVYVNIHQAYSSTNDPGAVPYDGYPTKLSTIKLQYVETKDAAEILADSMNLRFEVPGESTPKLVIDRSYRSFYTASRYPGLMANTKFTWPYENECGERNKRIQLYEKYRTTNYEDFIVYDDPFGVFDSSRLKLWFENAAGEEILNTSYDGADVLCDWQEGTIYLAACYGTLKSTQQKTKITMPYQVITSDPSYVPIRDIWNRGSSIQIGELDFSQWYPASTVVDVTPSDALINCSDFYFTNEQPGEILFFEKIGDSGTLDDQYRVRISGGGYYNGTLTHYENDGIYSSQGVILEYGLPYWDGYRYIAVTSPDTVVVTPSKSSIQRGEYVFVNIQYNPDEEFTLYAHGYGIKGWRYSVDGEQTWLTSSELNNLGYAEVICESRKGVILKNKSGNNNTVSITWCQYWKNKDSSAYNPAQVTLLNSTYSQSGTLTINARTNQDGTIADDQTLSLTGGTVAGWNSSSWRYASINRSGQLKTYSSGPVTIYAVTTDGRLASSDYITPTEDGSAPYIPEPIDTTLREADDTSDDVILYFSESSVSFDSSSSSAKTVEIIRESHNFDLRNVIVVSENPKVATVAASYNATTDKLEATITPAGKGNTIIRIVCGGAESSINVSVQDGTTASTPKLEYMGQYGVSLNIYEYADIQFKVDSSNTYNSLTYRVPFDNISVEARDYNSSTGVVTLRIGLTDHGSGYVEVKAGTEKLTFSIANRFNLKFETISGAFRLGYGATREIKLYPLDDTVTVSSIQVYPMNRKVQVGTITEELDDQGKRVFIVPVISISNSAATDILVAHRKGDSDVYLDIECTNEYIGARRISASKNRITINKQN